MMRRGLWIFLLNGLAHAAAASENDAPSLSPVPSVKSIGPIAPERYNLGKEIFAGQAQLPEEPSSAELKKAQEKLLGAYQNQLPKSLRSAEPLTPLAGRLSAEQLAALVHFLEIRFLIKPEPEPVH